MIEAGDQMTPEKRADLEENLRCATEGGSV
jgi:hypothetical protein